MASWVQEVAYVFLAHARLRASLSSGEEMANPEALGTKWVLISASPAACLY